jgi:hypothetical protein
MSTVREQLNCQRGRGRGRHRRTRRRLALVVALLLPSLALAAQARELIEFEIEDQFKVKHTDAEFRGRVLVLVGGGRKGSEHAPDWRAAISDGAGDAIESGELLIVSYADTRGVPFFLKGTIRGYFPQDPELLTLVDWKGQLAEAYSLDPDVATLLVFGRDDRLVSRVSGTEVEPAQVEALLGVLRDLLGR